MLDEVFLLEEIKKIVFSFGDIKTLGPLYFCLLQTILELIINDDLCLFDAFHKGTLELPRLNYAFISFIPKKKGVPIAHNFRLISLLNSLYKVMSKVLSKRAAKCLP